MHFLKVDCIVVSAHEEVAILKTNKHYFPRKTDASDQCVCKIFFAEKIDYSVSFESVIFHEKV